MSTEADEVTGLPIAADAAPGLQAADQGGRPAGDAARQHPGNAPPVSAPVNHDSAAKLAWLIAFLGLAGMLTAFAAVLYFVFTLDFRQTISLDDLLIPIPAAAYALVGALIASRHPKNPIGWIYLAVSWLYGTSLALEVYRTYGPELGASGYVPALFDNLWILRILLPTLFVFLLFPNGALISRRWRIILWSAILGLSVNHLALALHPGPVPQFDIEANPGGIPALADTLDIVLGITRPLLLVGIVGSIAAFVLRVGRSRGIERQQMKWLGYTVFLVSCAILFDALAWSLWSDNSLAIGLSQLMLEFSILSIAVVTGVTILRYRLYEIDLVINRTLVYGALTVSVVAIYLLFVVGVGTLVQAEGSVIHSLMGTVLIAIIFQPLRDRLQRAVDRLMYGERDEPFEALARLGQRLESIFSPELIYPTIVETVAQALKLPYVAIVVKHRERFETVQAHGRSSGDPVDYPLIDQGQTIGKLLIGRRGRDEQFSAADERLLQSFARQASAAVHIVQLTVDLQRSRQQLVTAREEERRRLRRDLHDGLGPVLASVVWQADSARDMVYGDPAGALQLLEGSIEQAQAALADIRRLVYGLRPPALDELGLVGALEQAARQHQQVSVAIEAPMPLPSLPAAVEVAAYRIAQEAIKNAVQHGKARNCAVCLSLNSGLTLAVSDDGLGLPEALTQGVGLVSMRERAEELGGVFAIRRRSLGGTEVEVFLPLELEKAS